MSIKRSLAICATVATTFVAAAPALAWDCGNASKPVGAGEKAILSETGVEWIGKSWQNQLDHGKTPDQLHGGFVGFDLTGSGTATVDTYANPHGEIPHNAQVNGSPCHGVVPIENAITCNS